ncbi:hypothetical protein PNOK_0170200 [Pyrrhoderma noxium]|uniref:C2H2-type domain-containing protein n=1 Tax=Pyrrhoderma noxium TaxID=2282107 RepID=A0A286UQJ3_9AGAM|nr:hypothetical protein PNOK_0170200 [Pyrrhoderma noxium]
MSNNPTSPKKVAPNSPGTQNTKSHEQQPSKPASASASVSGTKSVSSSHLRDSTPLRSSPRPETPTSPRNSTPQRDSTSHRDNTLPKSSTATNKKSATQVAGDRTTSKGIPIREVPKEVKKSVTPEPVRSPRPLSSGFTSINSVTNLAPISITSETGDASKSMPLLKPKRQVSGDDAKSSYKKSKSASDHPVTASASSSTSTSASASKTRVTPTPEMHPPSTTKKTTVTTTENALASEQSKGSKKLFSCERCNVKFSRICDKERHLSDPSKHKRQRKPDQKPHYLCSHENCGRRLATPGALGVHEAIHRNEFACDFCGIPKGSAYLLKIHVERRDPYYCKLDHEGDSVPPEGLKFCDYKTYLDHHKKDHKDIDPQQKNPKVSEK